MTGTDGWRPVRLDENLSAFERDGSAAETPVVLLHGAGGNALVWLGVAPAFEGRRVLLVDMPGHGASASPSSWDLDDTAASVAAAANRHLRSEPAIWGGHSWGGKVAGLVAAASPAACAGLVLFDPSPCAAVPIDNEEFVDGIWSVEMAPHASREAAARAARELPHWQPWDDVAARAFAHGLAEREDGTWSLCPSRDELLALAAATLHVDRTDQLAANSAVPALLLYASESAAWQSVTNLPLYAEATQVEIPGPHWIQLASREACIASVRRWLARSGD